MCISNLQTCAAEGMPVEPLHLRLQQDCSSHGAIALLQEEDLLTCAHGRGVDVITDKGTLDAIGLSDNPRGR
jgi:hypothetical protein